MANSAEYQVLLALKAALEEITVANSYNTDVQLVELYEKFADQRPVFPCIAIAEIGTTEDQTRFGEKNEVTMTVVLSCAIETYTNEHELVGEFVADIKKRLFADLPTFLPSITGGGSRLITVERTERVHSTEEDPRAGADIFLSILFRHPIDDPYTLTP